MTGCFLVVGESLIPNTTIMNKKDNLLEILDDKIRNNHSKRLLACKPNDEATIAKIEKDFEDDMSHYGVSKEDSKKVFTRLKKTHLQ